MPCVTIPTLYYTLCYYPTPYYALGDWLSPHHSATCDYPHTILYHLWLFSHHTMPFVIDHPHTILCLLWVTDYPHTVHWPLWLTIPTHSMPFVTRYPQTILCPLWPTIPTHTMPFVAYCPHSFYALLTHFPHTMSIVTFSIPYCILCGWLTMPTL